MKDINEGKLKETNKAIIVADRSEKGKNERKLEIMVFQETKNMAMMLMIKGMISDYGRDTKVSTGANSFTYHSAASSEIIAHLDCETIKNEASKKFITSIYDIELAKYVFNEVDKMSVESVKAYLDSQGL
jgi:hypothetical protein